jgi:hypothetical protein
MPVPWRSNKNGLPGKSAWQHSHRVKGDAARGQDYDLVASYPQMCIMKKIGAVSVSIIIRKCGFEAYAGRPLSEPRTYIVFGAARGGTSLVSGALRLCGVNMGDPIDQDNNEDLVFNSHNGDVNIFKNKTKKNIFIERIRGYIGDKNSNLSVWGWKDPLAINYITDIFPIIQNPYFIFISRDPVAVVMRESVELQEYPSSFNKDHFHVSKALECLSIYQSEINFISNQNVPTLYLSYERCLRNPDDFARKIIEFSGVSCKDHADRILLNKSISAYTKPDALSGSISSVDVSVSYNLTDGGLKELLSKAESAAKCYEIAARLVNSADYEGAITATDFILGLRTSGFMYFPHLIASPIDTLNIEAGACYIRSIAQFNMGDIINSCLSIGSYFSLKEFLSKRNAVQTVVTELEQPAIELVKKIDLLTL